MTKRLPGSMGKAIFVPQFYKKRKKKLSNLGVACNLCYIERFCLKTNGSWVWWCLTLIPAKAEASRYLSVCGQLHYREF